MPVLPSTIDKASKIALLTMSETCRRQKRFIGYLYDSYDMVFESFVGLFCCPQSLSLLRSLPLQSLQ